MSTSELNIEEPTSSTGGNVVSPGFEGPEKNLEIDFVPTLGPTRGLRDITRSQWDSICTAARCSILNHFGNPKCDSYLLSESSLFVYSHKVVMKTCGTTTLLMAIEPLLAITTAMGMKVEWLAYTRKDFIFPTMQKFPHRDPAEEVRYGHYFAKTSFLLKVFPEGHAYVMGPLTADHWFVFVADYVDRPTELCVDRTLDMMMFDLDADVAQLFVKDTQRFPSDADVTRAAGIHTLLPGSLVQEFAFEPCGYSMNGLLYDAYWTIHITPESHCSYASFETNIRMTNFSPLIKAVLAIFRPKRFTMTLFADTAGVAALRETPFQQLISVPVVESNAPALTGPCIITHDATGASEVHYPKAVTATTPTNAAAVTNATTPIVVSGDGGSGGSGNTVPSTAVEADGSTTSTPPSVPTTAAADAAPPNSRKMNVSTNGSGPVLRRGTSVARTLVDSSGNNIVLGPSTSMSYVMSSKSHTEFLGDYVSVLGNFKLVHSDTVSSPDAVKSGASETLANPRAKYIVERSMRNAMGKTRTESM